MFPFVATSVQAAKLIEALKKDGVSIPDSNAWQLARYNAPFTIPYFRTNEIHMPVEGV